MSMNNFVDQFSEINPENQKLDAAILPRHRLRQGLSDGRHVRLQADVAAAGRGARPFR